MTHHPSRDLVHYYVDQKNPHHGQAIIKGFNARARNALNARLEPGSLHIIGGLQHGSAELMAQALDAGEPYIFVDRAYFGGGPGSDRLRVVPSAYQHHWQQRADGERLKTLRAAGLAPDLVDWRRQGSHVLVVPPSDAVRKLFHIEHQMAELEKRVRACFDGPVIVSRKGQGKPAREHFENCWAVVTWTSNVAVEAVCAGIPCFVSRASAAAPVSLTLDQIEKRIETPYYADNRESWAAGLADGQFTLDEIASGLAAETTLAYFR